MKIGQLANLLSSFVPPPRFQGLDFEQYQPNADYPSQKEALLQLKTFVEKVNQPKKLFFSRKAKIQNLYLDGSFGVGKTHLLTATWREIKGPKTYFSFAELVFFIGSVGMKQAIAAFNGYQFIAVDEFELDDPGNTLIIATFLSSLVQNGTKIVATSNTLPERLGQGRFNAEDFKREIATLASYFDVITIDGPDYRHRERSKIPEALMENDLKGLYTQEKRAKIQINFDDLNIKLTTIHPIYFGQIVSGTKILFLDNIRPIKSQDVALRFVHFIDKLYEQKIDLAFSGCSLDKLFDESYRFGVYAKKYGRCLSRLVESISQFAVL